MRVLTVRQPWAWAIVHGGKDVENRVRNIAGEYRGPVAIHVGLRDDDDAFEPEHPVHGMLFGSCPRATSGDHNSYHCEWCTRISPSKYGLKGCIIGVADLVDVHEVCGPPFPGGGWPVCSPWAELDVWHLQFTNPQPLVEPFRFTGALGMRTLDPAVEGRVWDGVAS